MDGVARPKAGQNEKQLESHCSFSILPPSFHGFMPRERERERDDGNGDITGWSPQQKENILPSLSLCCFLSFVN
jgi:hypothetical protein